MLCVVAIYFVVFSFSSCLLALPAAVLNLLCIPLLLSMHHTFLIWEDAQSSLSIFILLKLGCVLPAGRGVSSDEDSYRLCLDGISSISTLVAMVTYFVGDLTLTWILTCIWIPKWFLIMCSKRLCFNEVIKLLWMQKIACHMPGKMIKGSRNRRISQNRS